MRFKYIIYVNIIFICCSINLQLARAHNIKNGGCKDHCIINFIEKENKDNTKNLKENYFLIEESNSCLNNYLCRG